MTHSLTNQAKQTASKRKTEDINFEEKKLHQQLPEGSPTKREPSPESDAGSAQGEVSLQHSIIS